jgi:hypothetical protein
VKKLLVLSFVLTCIPAMGFAQEKPTPEEVRKVINYYFYLWMNFLVPAGDQAKILLQYSRKDKVRETSNVSLAGATRYRTWKKIPTATAGDWEVDIVQELDSSDLDMGQLKFSVVEAQ